MSAERDLFDAYRNWHRLAKAAHQAIQQRNWNFVLECQGIIQKIQPLVSQLTSEARLEWRQRKLDLAAKENQLFTIISELMALLESNQKLLRSVRAKAVSQREQLGQAGLNLKRLQTSYVFTRPSVWTSFS
jgi:hypothetical protein